MTTPSPDPITPKLLAAFRDGTAPTKRSPSDPSPPPVLDQLHLLRARLADIRAEIDAIEFGPLDAPGALSMESRGKVKDASQFVYWAVTDIGYVLDRRHEKPKGETTL